MRVLLVESTPGNASAVKKWLHDAGHETATCFDPPVELGCKGADHHDDCPLSRSTDVALLVRDLDGGTRTLTEMGAVCALRHRVPVVEITEPEERDLDATMCSALADALTGAATEGYVQAVRVGFSRVASLTSAADVGVTVTRSPDRVHAMLTIPADVADNIVPMVVDSASRALRAHDPYVKVIDVGMSRLA